MKRALWLGMIALVCGAGLALSAIAWAQDEEEATQPGAAPPLAPLVPPGGLPVLSSPLDPNATPLLDMEPRGKGFANAEGVARDRQVASYPFGTEGADLLVDEIVGMVVVSGLDNFRTETRRIAPETITSVGAEYLDEWFTTGAGPLVPITRLYLDDGSVLRVVGPARDIRGLWGYARRQGVVDARFKIRGD